jgi:mono/diheme cytochrome c family protein
MPFHFRCSRSSIVVFAAAALFAGRPWYSHGAEEPSSGVIASGERLVHLLDCNACHTPKVLTPQGPRPDSSRLLSGHPADEKLPPIPEGLIGPAGWGGLFNNNLTAWAGPWGVSFATNLTPDPDTGIGSWTEEIFVEAIRTGMHVEEGRPFLPPMPTYARLTDEELHAIFTYLRSIKPVRNTVPTALPPQKPKPKG